MGLLAGWGHSVATRMSIVGDGAAVQPLLLARIEPALCLTTQTVLPGGYPNPTMVATLRYWDGAEGTYAVSPLQQQNSRQISVDPAIFVDSIFTVALVIIGGLFKVFSAKPNEKS